jgi:hypothetical protein
MGSWDQDSVRPVTVEPRHSPPDHVSDVRREIPDVAEWGLAGRVEGVDFDLGGVCSAARVAFPAELPIATRYFPAPGVSFTYPGASVPFFFAIPNRVG